MLKVLLLAGFAVLTVCSYSIDSGYAKLVHIGEFEDSKDLDTFNLDANSLGQVYHFTSNKGKRVFGDQLITRVNRFANSSYSAPLNMKTTLTLFGDPRKLITYIEVELEQTSDRYDVSIISGGLHHVQVTLSIKSISTMYQNFTLAIYGK